LNRVYKAVSGFKEGYDAHRYPAGKPPPGAIEDTNGAAYHRTSGVLHGAANAVNKLGFGVPKLIVDKVEGRDVSVKDWAKEEIPFADKVID
jgi:hypothetical protein